MFQYVGANGAGAVAGSEGNAGRGDGHGGRSGVEGDASEDKVDGMAGSEGEAAAGKGSVEGMDDGVDGVKRAASAKQPGRMMSYADVVGVNISAVGVSVAGKGRPRECRVGGLAEGGTGEGARTPAAAERAVMVEVEASSVAGGGFPGRGGEVNVGKEGAMGGGSTGGTPAKRRRKSKDSDKSRREDGFVVPNE